MSTAAIVAIVVGSVVAYALIGSVSYAFELRRSAGRYWAKSDAVAAGIAWPFWMFFVAYLLVRPLFSRLGEFGVWVVAMPDRRRAKRNAAGLPKATAKERTK